MQLEPGQTVLLKQTRERAKVISELEDDHWLLESLMDHEKFPVHENDIDPIVGAVKVPNQKVADKPSVDIRLYPDADGPAVQLGFTPVGNLDYTAVLLNFSDESLVYGARMITNKGQQWDKHGILPSAQGVQLGHLYRDLLNESAQVEIDVSRKAEMGTDSKQQKVIKLKPKLFYKNTKEVSWFPEELAVFDVFAKAKLVRKEEPSIKAYAKANAPQVPAKPKKLDVNRYGVMAAASFSSELDLHIEKLVDDHSEMSGSDMLDLQLQHMRSYLDVAIRVGIDRVYLIHGNGKGALKAAIHAELGKMGDLDGFNNDYHPKYANGATTVILRA